MSLTDGLALVFFLTFSIYVFLGIYVLAIDSKALISRLFFTLCISLCIWSFGFSIACSASDYETALFWRRFDSFGWGTAYSILMHFTIVLTGRERVFRNKLMYVLIYFPALFFVVIFGISDSARYRYNLVKTTMGWINVSEHRWEDLLYNAYFISFTIIVIWLIYDWSAKSADIKRKKQTYAILGAFIITTIVGIMTEMVLNAYTSYTVPQIAPIIAMFPIMVVLYSNRRYGLLISNKKSIAEHGKILSDETLVKLFNFMSIALVFGGLVCFIALYFFYIVRPDINYILLYSLSFFIMASVLYFIKRRFIKSDIKEVLLVTILSIPIIFATFLNINNGNTTVWAIPVIVVMMCVLFNKRRIIFGLGIFILIIQIFVWIRFPKGTVQIDGSDHLTRIGIYCIILWLAYYINQIYKCRLEENEAQISFQKTVSGISADFVTLNETNLYEKINFLLEQSGEYFQADRSYLISLTSDLNTVEWCAEGIERSDFIVPLDVCEASPESWTKQLFGNSMVLIPDIELLPPEMGKGKGILEQLNVKSLISMPIFNMGEIQGVLLFATVREKKVWQEEHQNLLKILVNLLSDAIIKVKAERKINYMAYYDSLTGLPNRALFKDRLEQAIYLAKRNEKLIGVVFLDIDSFKLINDSAGHFGGDEILRELALRLSEGLRKHDTVSRFSGDEFLIQITQLDEEKDIHRVVDKIMKLISQPLKIKGHEFFVTASLGVSVYPTDGETVEALMKNADLAMYISKNSGKNKYTICSTDIKEDALKRIKLTNALYRAIERNELDVYYQPQVSVSTKEIVGAEALIRWNNPEFGMVQPSSFIPLAEKTGLINSIGAWVLKTACIQIKKWHAMGLPLLRIAVNVSIEQFRDFRLVDTVDRVLKETGFNAKYLEMEITESIAVEGEEHVIKMLHQLKELGILISIDDFGMEYSSLGRLKTLPIDQLKIDMRFVQNLSKGNSKDEAIVRTIIQLAKNLELNVIVEGIETEEQFRFFEKENCDEIQGYYFYRPMPSSELEKILKTRHKKK